MPWLPSGSWHDLVALQETLELAETGWVPHLTQGLCLDLADSLAGHLELFADLLERTAVSVAEAKSQFEPNTFVLSDAAAKKIGGPNAVGGLYERQPDGTYVVYPFDPDAEA